MVLTIVEAGKLAASNGQDKKAGVIMTFAESSPLLAAMPVVPISGNSYAWTREKTLPSVAFRGVNEAYTESTGDVETVTEPLKLIGGDLDVDRFLIQTNGPAVRTAHERMKAVAMGQTIGAKLITGSTASSKKEFDGLAFRFGGGISSVTASTQVVSNGAAALSMKNLDAVIDAVDPSIGKRVLVMTLAMRRNMTAFLRGSGTAIQITQDAFGNPVETYQGLPILVADENGNQAAMAFNENGNTTSSIYVCALGPTGLHMIQNGGIDVRDLGEINTSPVFRTRVEWYTGLVPEHPRCVARLYNITNATAVA